MFTSIAVFGLSAVDYIIHREETNHYFRTSVPEVEASRDYYYPLINS